MSATSPLACIECQADLLVDTSNLTMGEILICPSCGAEQQVVSEAPPKVRGLADEEEAGEG